MASRNYKYYQPNDKDLKDQYGDCVVRALTKVMRKTWMQVFDDLISYAKKLQCINRVFTRAYILLYLFNDIPNIVLDAKNIFVVSSAF